MRSKAIASLLLSTIAIQAEAQVGPYMVYDSKGQLVGGLGGTASVIRKVNGHVYAVDDSLTNSFLGYTFYYSTANCTGQPYATNLAAQQAVLPAQYYNGPAANGHTGWLYGPVPASETSDAIQPTWIVVNSEAFNWGTTNWICYQVNPPGGTTLSLIPVYPLQNVSNMQPPFKIESGY